MPFHYTKQSNIWFDDIGTGPTVMLVHGFPLDGSIWRGVVERMMSQRRLIVPDLRGFGRSDPARFSTMTELADDLADLSQSIAGGPCVTVGLSMGGYVLQELTRQHPKVVRHLVLIDTKAEADTTDARNKRDAMADTVRREGPGAIADIMLPNMLRNGAAHPTAGELRKIIESQRSETLADACVAMRDREDFVAHLSELDIQVDLIVGEDDAITPPLLMKAMHEKLKDGRIFIIPDAGHMSPLEQPAAVAEVLLKVSHVPTE